MSDQEEIDAPVIAIDIEASSHYEGAEQARLYDELQSLFTTACTEVGLEVDPRDRADRGDGNVIVIRSGFDQARLVSDLPRELAGALDQFNRTRNDAARLRVRMAVQRGPLWGRPGRWDGHAIVDACRLMNAQVTRTLLAEQSNAAMVLCISQAVFDSTVRERRRHLDPDHWARFEIGQVEKGSGIRAWARLLGHGAPETTIAPVPVEPPSISGQGSRTSTRNYGVLTQGDGSHAFGAVQGDVRINSRGSRG